MKKTLVALAALAVVGAASAQSTVSMTGVIGAAYQSVDSAAGTAARGTTLTNADFKLTAMEDLGGGMRAVASASFETPTPGSSTPSGTFGQGVVRRDTSVGLMGEFGTVSFTNTRSGNLLTKGMVAPANLQDIIYDSNVVTRAAVDAVTYLTKPMNGLQALVQWIDTAADGNTTPAVNVLVLGGTYAQGPLELACSTRCITSLTLHKTLQHHWVALHARTAWKRSPLMTSAWPRLVLATTAPSSAPSTTLPRLVSLQLISTNHMPIPWASQHLLVQ